MDDEISAADLGLLGTSASMLRLIEQIRRCARSSHPVLIRGENGTGKELVAKAVHALSSRSANHYRAVNCSTFTEQLIDDKLFGHAKGAFTGATSARPGCFEDVGGGTLFLDELGEFPLALQAKLLRVVESGELERIGSNDPITVDVRLITATNRDLDEFVRERRFREDLYHRLNVLTIQVPPLRERGEDVMILAEHFLQVEAEKEGKPGARFSDEARKMIRSLPWTGNVRQLRNVIIRGLTEASTGPDGTEVRPEHFGPVYTSLTSPAYGPLELEPLGQTTLADLTVEALEANEPPLLGLRHGDDAIGRVASWLIQSLADGFALYLNTEQGQKRLSNLKPDALLELCGLPRMKKSTKQLLMKAIRDRLAALIKDRQPGRPGAPDANRRRDRRPPQPNGD